MTFGESIKTCFSKYIDGKGRASRSEYWYFYLLYIASYWIANLSKIPLLFIPVLLMLAPLFAAGVRRMHDVDKSGWFLFVPIYNLILLCSSGTPGPNRFGSPYADTSSMAPPTSVV